jgi:hypothetical protein
MLVLRDVVDRKISAARAEEVYGVVVDPETATVARSATEARRRALDAEADGR